MIQQMGQGILPDHNDFINSPLTLTVYNLVKNDFDFKLNNYPIWDENYRQTLNDKLINHYLFEQIGMETPALFRHYLVTAMNEIMPYYNKIYLSTIADFDLINDFKRYTESEQHTIVDNNTDSTTTDNTTNLSATSDTPQSFVGDLFEHGYVSNTGQIENNSIAESVTDQDISTDDHRIFNEYGYNNYPAENLIKFREAVINIDMMVINDPAISSCFLGVYTV